MTLDAPEAGPAPAQVTLWTLHRNGRTATCDAQTGMTDVPWLPERLTAIHEAGHVVVAWSFRRTVESASILPSESDPLLSSGRAVMGAGANYWATCVTALAGEAAECVHLARVHGDPALLRHYSSGTLHDYTLVKEALTRGRVPHARRPERLADARMTALERVTRHYRRLLLVASALEQSQELVFADLERLRTQRMRRRPQP